MTNEVIISGLHVELTDALKSFTTTKAQKLFHHNSHIIRLRVELAVEKNKAHTDEFIAKGRVEISGPDLIASAASDDLYKSIDMLIEKLDRQLKEHMHKHHSELLANKTNITPTTNL